MEHRTKQEILEISIFLILYGIAIRLLLGAKWEPFIAVMMTYFIPVAGKELLVPWCVYLHINVIAPISAIVLIDVLTCLVVLYNWWLVDKIINRYKIAKKYYLKVQNKALKLDGKSKYGMYAFLFFIMITPVQGGGSMTVALIGKMLGLSNRKILFIVVSGSLSVLMVITLLSLQLLHIGGII